MQSFQLLVLYEAGHLTSLGQGTVRKGRESRQMCRRDKNSPGTFHCLLHPGHTIDLEKDCACSGRGGLAGHAGLAIKASAGQRVARSASATQKVSNSQAVRFHIYLVSFQLFSWSDQQLQPCPVISRNALDQTPTQAPGYVSAMSSRSSSRLSLTTPKSLPGFQLRTEDMWRV